MNEWHIPRKAVNTSINAGSKTATASMETTADGSNWSDGYDDWCNTFARSVTTKDHPQEATKKPKPTTGNKAKVYSGKQDQDVIYVRTVPGNKGPTLHRSPKSSDLARRAQQSKDDKAKHQAKITAFKAAAMRQAWNTKAKPTPPPIHPPHVDKGQMDVDEEEDEALVQACKPSPYQMRSLLVARAGMAYHSQQWAEMAQAGDYAASAESSRLFDIDQKTEASILKRMNNMGKVEVKPNVPYQGPFPVKGRAAKAMAAKARTQRKPPTIPQAHFQQEMDVEGHIRVMGPKGRMQWWCKDRWDDHSPMECWAEEQMAKKAAKDGKKPPHKMRSGR